MGVDITTLDSNEEIHFAWYLEELKEHGYILGYQSHPFTFELGRPMKFECVKLPLPKKANPSLQERELLPKNTYTPDFAIYWTKKAEGIFFEKVGVKDRYGEPHVVLDKKTAFLTHWSMGAVASRHLEMLPRLEDQYDISVVDVKPDVIKRFAKNASTVHTFPIQQKWVMDKYNIYVQKVVAEGKMTCLFARTFTPNRYLTNDKLNTSRNIHHKTPTIGMFVAQKELDYGKIKRRYYRESLLFNLPNSETT